MKQTIYLTLALSFFLFSCGKNKTDRNYETSKENVLVKTEQGFVSRVPVKAGETGILLPRGTRITVAKDASAIRVELPKGYSFLATSPESRTLPVSNIGTYKCVCSASDGTACQVFYQEDAGGFGCLHKSCTGSCTGSLTANSYKIVGVINLLQDQPEARKDNVFEKASLSEGGMEVFFSRSDVQAKIKVQYDILYKHLALPDFTSIEKSRAYVYVTVRLYGVSFYILAPAQVKQLRGIEIIETSASCECTNTAGGTCIKKSWGFLGYRVYWCEGGCNGCALTVN